MLAKGEKPHHGDHVTPDEEIKDPFVLEFLDLKDEYSETDLEEALIRQLETFLMELGDDFCFIGRQRRLRVGGHVVSRRSAILPPGSAMSCSHRLEDR